MTEPIIEIKSLSTQISGSWILKNLDLTINRGEIFGIVGGSGSGKTTLMRQILMLRQPNAGSIRVFGQELTTASPAVMHKVQHRIGVLFQQNALFSSLSVLENIMFPLKEHVNLDANAKRDLALIKLLLVGLTVDAAVKLPAELSGGMQKRAALARAIVLDPELIFLDEPTAGLDPDSASSLDELILNLQTTMGLTVVIITHDLDTLWRVTNRVAFLSEGKVLCVDAMEKLVKHPDPVIQQFFNGPRGRVVRENY